MVVLLNFDLVCENALYMLFEKDEFRSSLTKSSSSNSSNTLISSSRTGKLSKLVAVAILISIFLRHLSDEIGVYEPLSRVYWAISFDKLAIMSDLLVYCCFEVLNCCFTLSIVSSIDS